MAPGDAGPRAPGDRMPEVEKEPLSPQDKGG